MQSKFPIGTSSQVDQEPEPTRGLTEFHSARVADAWRAFWDVIDVEGLSADHVFATGFHVSGEVISGLACSKPSDAEPGTWVSVGDEPHAEKAWPFVIRVLG